MVCFCTLAVLTFLLADKMTKISLCQSIIGDKNISLPTTGLITADIDNQASMWKEET